MFGFVYIARDLAGERKRGFKQSTSQHEVRTWLREQGLIPLEVTPTASISAAKRRIFGLKAPKAAEKAAFCWQLATMIGGGVPITEAIDTIAEDIENVRFRQSLEQVSGQIKKGESFSDSLAEFRTIFSRLFCGMIQVGETSGSLPIVLSRLAEYMDQRDKFARKVKGAMAYPIFVVVFVLFVFVFMMTVIIPKFRMIFADFGGELPRFTVGFLTFHDIMAANIIYIVASLIALIGTVMVYSRTKAGHARLSRLLLSLPLFGRVVSQAFIAMFCKTMATLLATGVSIIEAFDILSETTDNDVIRTAILRSREQIVEGSSISSAVANSGFFPNMVSKMVEVGEKSGSLPKVLAGASAYYERKVDTIVTVLLNLLGPVVIVVVGGMVLVVVLALYLPIFTMSGVVSGTGM